MWNYVLRGILLFIFTSFTLISFVYAETTGDSMSPLRDSLTTASESRRGYSSRYESRADQAASRSEATGGNNVNQFSGVGSSGSGAYNQAVKAQNKSNQTAMMGLMIALMSIPQCGPQNPMACAMAAAGMAVAALGAKKANDAKNVRDQLGFGASPEITKTDQKTQEIKDRLAQASSGLNGKGYKLNDDGSVSLPNGQILSQSDFTQQGLQEKMGLSEQQAQELLDKFGKSDGNLKTASIAEAEEEDFGELGSLGGGGGSGRKSRFAINNQDADEDGETGSALHANQPITDDAERNLSSVGLFRNRDGEKMGVAQSDLFLQMQQRIDVERVRMGE